MPSETQTPCQRCGTKHAGGMCPMWDPTTIESTLAALRTDINEQAKQSGRIASVLSELYGIALNLHEAIKEQTQASKDLATAVAELRTAIEELRQDRNEDRREIHKFFGVANGG